MLHRLLTLRNMAILCMLACLFQTESLRAQTFLGASPEALGGAGRAAVNAIDSHYLNPAAVAFSRDYNLGGTFQMSRNTLENPVNTSAFVITDASADKIVSGGFGYLYRRSSTPSTTLIDQDLSASLSGKIIETIAVGFGGHRLSRQNSNGTSFTKNNMSFGVLVVPVSYLGFSFVTYDFLNDDDLDLVPAVGFGSHIIIMDIVRLRADVTRQEKRNPDKQGSLNLGMEINVGEGFLLRTGGWWDGLNHQTYWTGGLAWEGPKLSLAYAARNNTTVNGDLTQTFSAWLVF